MSKVYTDNIEKRTGGTAMAVPATGKWPTANIADDAIGADQLAADAVGTAALSATGTASATTFLRGDNSWAAVDTTGIDANKEDIALLAFKTQANGNLARYNLIDQSVDAFEDASGVSASDSTDATRDTAGKYYSGSSSPTGGTITTYSTYTVHSFLSGTENFSSAGGTVDILAIGGGGSGSDGGGSGAGGGGAGGMVEFSGTIASGAHSVVIGPGGAEQPTGGQHGNAGTDTTFGSIITGRGGGGGGNYTENSPSSGGSSGGGGAYNNNAYDSGPFNTPAYSGSGTQYSSRGGDAWTSGIPNSGAAGGGGAGGTNAANATNYNGTPGAAGRANSIRTGSSVTYAGGGGGSGMNPSSSQGAGGSGGGGAATMSGPSGVGTVNTGSGSGGVSSGTSGLGGSGIVVVRYTTGTLSSISDMTLQSNAFTAQADPTTTRIILDEQDYAGITTLDTDLKAYASRDNGTTFTQMPLAKQADILNTGGNPASTKLLLHMNGANTSTTFTDSSASAHTVTAVNQAQISTAQSKFGGSSGLFDGTTDGLTIPDSADWDWSTSAYTIDMWIRANATQSGGTYGGLVNSAGTSWGTGEWTLSLVKATGVLEWWVNDGSLGASAIITSTTDLTDDAWHHVAVTRDGSNNNKIFVDGVQEGSTFTTSYSISAPATGLIIGDNNYSANRDYTGYINELRLVQGDATWTENFAVPLAQYGSGDYIGPRKLLSGSVDISGQPAGSNMKYKLETLNQSASKQTRVYGTSMAWA